ncbi:TonB-dependent receptor family protein [Chenggangzhangella methanolivorans]|uniref:TonB-dependent receptor n=1 Tax=Chenggangzhangella methanolivorans TaxID=1437009 RepID=A0A9E6UNY7_9HYPH|nr:TonB-dependent receptor [Chenggangzhangella methanolivorans]QZO01636.1 TonB-dependent receptor [Chenggangzhangella methanolivorans]
MALFAATSVAALLAPTALRAQESGATQLDPIDVRGALGQSPVAGTTAEQGPVSPIDAREPLPANLQNFAGSADRVTAQDLESERPLTAHDALRNVPGVATVADDGFGRHSGISLRGSPHRRSRKILVMEDGVPINFSPYLDAGTHYTPPMDRVESIDVLKGPMVNYGPLNNHGVVNFKNLSPFGPKETVFSAGIGTTKGVDQNVNNMRHAHTRQSVDNVGVVLSYSGLDAGGSWDAEKLGYNDFYGAVGIRGENQDLTVSGGFFRQRDNYDEDNFSGTLAELKRFRRNKKDAAENGNFPVACGRCYDWNTYNADYYRAQVAHNLYIDDKTTLSTRLYGNHHDRARFYVSDESNDPPSDFVMEGRDRLYKNIGADSRIEFADLPLFGSLTQTVQAGVRYEEHDFHNKNRLGATNERLDYGNRGSLDEAQKLTADSFATFAQTAIKVTPDFTLVPGVRLERYKIGFRDLDDSSNNGDSTYTQVLPMLSFSWEFAPTTTLYGGYHRGLSPHILRDVLEADSGYIAPKKELGDNLQVGVRSKAVQGLTFDVAYFHSDIRNYQFGEAFQSDGGDRVFSSLDKARFDGVELAARIDSRAFIDSPWNVYGESVYTYVNSKIVKGTADGGQNVSGNEVPESMKHTANLTLGAQHASGFDASVSWTYRGGFYTALNLPMNPLDVEEGRINGVWLLSARASYKVTKDLTAWVTGQNLTDKFYISDRSDGAKLGVGRTVMAGMTLKLH